ncbi:hypothetical protein EV175_004801 [Coemansia sp. RSA 1933]|nr:hypothetical protein EV175_004801 [Coemansia sp. RSA 1933]
MKLASVIATVATTFMAVATAAESPSLLARTVSSGTVDWAEANATGTSVSGDFIFRPDSDGGLYIYVSATGLTKGASYPFHIHTNFVPTNGNCTATGGHFNPNNVDTTASKYKCDPSNIKATCELGDLSGIFGSMVGDDSGNFNGKYDATLLTFSGQDSILDRSVVIHNAAGDRIACGNITAYVLDNGDSNASDVDGSSGSEEESNSSSGSTIFVPLFSGLLAIVVAALAF